MIRPKIQFYEGEEWEQNAEPLLKENLQFDYFYGWQDFQEIYGMMGILLLYVILIIGFLQYLRRIYTADCGHPSVHTAGKKELYLSEDCSSAFLLPPWYTSW